MMLFTKDECLQAIKLQNELPPVVAAHNDALAGGLAKDLLSGRVHAVPSCTLASPVRAGYYGGLQFLKITGVLTTVNKQLQFVEKPAGDDPDNPLGLSYHNDVRHTPGVRRDVLYRALCTLNRGNGMPGGMLHEQLKEQLLSFWTSCLQRRLLESEGELQVAMFQRSPVVPYAEDQLTHVRGLQLDACERLLWLTRDSTEQRIKVFKLDADPDTSGRTYDLLMQLLAETLARSMAERQQMQRQVKAAFKHCKKGG